MLDSQSATIIAALITSICGIISVVIAERIKKGGQTSTHPVPVRRIPENASLRKRAIFIIIGVLIGVILSFAIIQTVNFIWPARKIGTLRGHTAPINNAIFSNDGQRVVTASDDGAVQLWDVFGSNIGEYAIHQDIVYSANWSPDRQMIITASRDKTARVLDITTGQEIAVLQHSASVLSAVFNRTGDLAATADSDGTVYLWNIQSSEEIQKLQLHGASVQTLAFSPNGNWLASGSQDTTTIIWDVSSTNVTMTKRLEGHRDAVTSVTFSPDSNTLASGSSDGSIILWSITQGRPLADPMRGDQNRVWSLFYNSNGDKLLSASQGVRFFLWNTEDYKLIQEIPIRLGPSYSGRSISFGPNDEDIFMSLVSGNTVEIWKASFENRQ